MSTDPEFVNIDNSSTLSNSLFTALTAGISIPAAPDFSDEKFNFTVDPTNTLYDDVAGSSIAGVTEGSNTLSGAGAFDVFMCAVDKHLEREYKENRITGSQYAEAYTTLVSQVIGQSVSFELQKEQSRWAAITAQMQARIAEIQATEALVNLERTKIEAANANFQLNLTAAQVALTKMQIATEEANHDNVTSDTAIKQFQRNYQQPAEHSITQYERTHVMPSTVAMNNVQVNRILPAQASIAEYQNRILQPLEKDLQELQRDRILAYQADMAQFQRDFIQPVELAQQQHILNLRQPAETNLIKERFEAERAKTMDTRSDNVTTIVGSIGKQKELYTQQIDSFIKDAQQKIGKMYLDSWITQKTLDEGLAAPTQLTNTEINEVLTSLRTNNSLGS